MNESASPSEGIALFFSYALWAIRASPEAARGVAAGRIVTPSRSRPRVADGAGDQVRHQRDLELVEVQGRGAARRRLPGELGDVRIERLAFDDALDGDEPPRHRAPPAAGDAAVLDHPVVHRHRRGDVDQREVPGVPVGDLLEVEVGAGPGLGNADRSENLLRRKRGHPGDVGLRPDEEVLDADNALALAALEEKLRIERK